MPADTEQKYWTAADVWALPEDGNRYECIDGELLVSPSPSGFHQLVVGEFHARLHAYLKSTVVGTLFASPSDVRLDRASVVQPDLYVVAPRAAVDARGSLTGTTRLLLAVEVLSSSTARYDRQTKRAFYQRNGVSEYWIVDSAAQLVERWGPTDPRPEILATELIWTPAGCSRPLAIDLPTIFADAARAAALAGIDR